jgi:hypothetical protein
LAQKAHQKYTNCTALDHIYKFIIELKKEFPGELLILLGTDSLLWEQIRRKKSVFKHFSCMNFVVA